MLLLFRYPCTNSCTISLSVWTNTSSTDSEVFMPFLSLLVLSSPFLVVLYWAPTLSRYLCTNSKVRLGLADILVGLLTAQLAEPGCRPRLACTSQRAPRQDCISFSPFKYFYILRANISVDLDQIFLFILSKYFFAGPRCVPVDVQPDRIAL